MYNNYLRVPVLTDNAVVALRGLDSHVFRQRQDNLTAPSLKTGTLKLLYYCCIVHIIILHYNTKINYVKYFTLYSIGYTCLFLFSLFSLFFFIFPIFPGFFSLLFFKFFVFNFQLL